MFIAPTLRRIGIMLLLAATSPTFGQVDQVAGNEKVAWLGIWSEAKELAAATGRPIFLLSAAPQCRNVPGIW